MSKGEDVAPNRANHSQYFSMNFQGCLLMIVEVIDVDGVHPFKPEDHAPVAGNRNSPMAAELSFETMQRKSRQVHILGRPARVETGQDKPEPSDVRRSDPALRPCLEQPLQSPVPETRDHNLCNL